MIIFVVMAKMVLLYPKPNAILDREVVRRVMNRVVANVAEYESAKDCGRELAKQQDKKPIKQNGQRDAYYRRHDEPAGIIWIIVVNAMNYEVQNLSGTALRFVMKDVPMHYVFEKRPKHDSERKQTSNGKDRQSPLPNGRVKHVADYRKVERQRRGRMHM
jgi:hypothetical protein